MSNSDKATNLQDVIDRVERRGWEYQVELSPMLYGYDGAALRPPGHTATVRFDGGPEATVFARTPGDALLAALRAVEGVVQAPAIQEPSEQPEPAVKAVLDAVAQAEQELRDDPVMAAYAQYDADPRTNGPRDFEAFRDAVQGTDWGDLVLNPAREPGQIPRREHTSMTDRVLCCYEEYTRASQGHGFGARNAQRFANAIQQHLGGTFVPPRGHPWTS